MKVIIKKEALLALKKTKICAEDNKNKKKKIKKKSLKLHQIMIKIMELNST